MSVMHSLNGDKIPQLTLINRKQLASMCLLKQQHRLPFRLLFNCELDSYFNDFTGVNT